MDEEIKGLKSALRAMNEEARARPGAHLSSETLVAYHHKELSPNEAEQARAHLVACRECTSLLLDLAAFGAREVEASALPSQAEIAASWNDLRDQLFTTPQAPEKTRPSKPPFLQRLRELFVISPAYALAALFILVSLALAVFVVSLLNQKRDLMARVNEPQNERARYELEAQECLNAARREAEESQRQAAEAKRVAEEAQRQRDEARARLEQLEGQTLTPGQAIGALVYQPQPNVEIKDLQLPTRGSETAQQEVVLRSGVNTLIFTIPIPAGEVNDTDFNLRIVNSRNAPVWSVGKLRSNEQGLLTVFVPRSKLLAGQYVFRVNSRDAKTEELTLRVVVSYK